jgi:prepilin-type processing-associated H-X9-DG protein
VNAEYGRPTMVLAGDRNLASAGTNAAGNPALRWTEELHRHKGNVLFADGHVERLNNPAFEVAAIGGTPQNVVLPEPSSSGPTAGLFPQEKPQPPPPTPEPSPTQPMARNQAGLSQNPASLTPSPTALLNLPLARFPIPPGVISVLAAQPKATVMHTNQTATVPEATSSGEAEALGTFDQAAVRYLQRLVKGGFGLLLLLLLLLLAYALWREWRKGQKRRARQQVTPEGL